MAFPKEYQDPPFAFADVQYDADGELEYTTSDMQLRILAKSLMLEQAECTIPRKQAELERTLGHVVFELAYRTHTVQDYIMMQQEANQAA